MSAGVNELLELEDGRVVVVWALADEEDREERGPGLWAIEGDDPKVAAEAFVAGDVDTEWIPAEAIR